MGRWEGVRGHSDEDCEIHHTVGHAVPYHVYTAALGR